MIRADFGAGTFGWTLTFHGLNGSNNKWVTSNINIQ